MHHPPAHDDRKPLPVGTVLRQGTIAEVIGFGLRGPVYRVHNTIAPDGVAVREFMPPVLSHRTGDVVQPRSGCEAAFEHARHAFEADAQRAAVLGTLCMVRSLGHWHERGTTFAAESWIGAPTVAESVHGSKAAVPQAELEAWMRALSEALLPLHRGRGVHGGITAQSLRLRPHGQPLLPGPANCRRAVAQANEGDLLAASPNTAPEQLKIGSALPLGPWTDVYALAAVLHLAIAGQPPQAAFDRMVAERGVGLGALAGSDFSGEFLQGVEQGLALRPHLRPQSLPQFLAALGIRERRRQPRGGAGGRLSSLPLPHVQELDIDLNTLRALGLAH